MPPAHVLYQGDIIVVPLILVDGTDPALISGSPKGRCAKCNTESPSPPKSILCGACGASVAVPPYPAPCTSCGKVPKEKQEKSYRPISVRLEKKEALFTKSDAEPSPGMLKVTAAIMMSHSCDIDSEDFVRLAVVDQIADLNEKQIEMVRKGTGHYGLFHLGETGRMPEAVVYLDRVFHISKDLIGQSVTFLSKRTGEEPGLLPFAETIEDRLGSLSAESLSQLYEACFRHDYRPDPESTVSIAVSESVFDTDDDRPKELPKRGWYWPLPAWLRARGPAR